MIRKLQKRRKCQELSYTVKHKTSGLSYIFMKFLLKEERVEPLTAPNLPEFRLFDYFTSAIHTLWYFEGICATYISITYSNNMGVDTLNIPYVGPLEQYVLATGRAGRDGKVSHAVMLFNKVLKKHVESMAKHCENVLPKSII